MPRIVMVKHHIKYITKIPVKPQCTTCAHIGKYSLLKVLSGTYCATLLLTLLLEVSNINSH